MSNPYTTDLFTLTSAQDGLALAGIMCVPQGQPKAVVQLCHGMAEMKERYLPFMEWLAGEGYVAAMIDHRGHGASVKSPDDLGYFGRNGAQAIVEDAHQVTGYLKKRFPGLPFILFGHSMGSLVVRCYLKKYDTDLNGLIVCGSPSGNPAAAFGVIMSRLVAAMKGERYISPLLINLTTGGFSKGLAEDESRNAWISYDKDNVARYDADPLCGFPFTANGYEALTTLLRDTYSKKGWHLTNANLPIHYVSGCDDPCMGNRAGFDAAVDFVRAMGYTAVSSKVYDGMRHEILNEKEHLTVYRDLEAFIASCL